jgi:UDP-N-acetylmuramoyl-tripeptide--D-alanyl-D-alanine ligase
MISLNTIINNSNFKYIGEQILEKITLQISVDSREVDQNSILVAIKGARFNPMEHLAEIAAKRCEFVIFEESDDMRALADDFKDRINFIMVKNIETAIGTLGELVAAQFKIRAGVFMAISGSNGKTTTRDMINHLAVNHLGAEKVVCTRNNDNNHLGVPFTLFQITEKTEFAIIELGSNAPGEIEFLCKMIKPQYGVTTNIGDTHLEFFETRENVFNEEAVLFNYISNTFFINNDDEFLKTLKLSDQSFSYGESNSDCTLEYKQNYMMVNKVELRNEFITGKHNFINLSLAYLICRKILKIKRDDAIKYSSEFKPKGNRSEWIEAGDRKVFLDAYNANPSSMKTALTGFFEHITPVGAKPPEACVVIGDMNELGDATSKLHEELGIYLKDLNPSSVIFVGRFAPDYAKGYGSKHKKFETALEVKDYLDSSKNSFKYLFIKGSRSLQLERILDIN